MAPKRSSDESQKRIQKYERPGLPAVRGQVSGVLAQLSAAAKGLSTEIREIRPRMTQALIDELRARLSRDSDAT